MKLNVTKYICYNAFIACVYLALVYIFQFMSFGAIQFRIAEAMTILPSLFPFSVAGLTIGCFLSNFMSVWGWSDLVFGTLCTLVAGLITSKIKNPFLAALPPVLINSFGLPLVWLLLGGETVYWINRPVDAARSDGRAVRRRGARILSRKKKSVRTDTARKGQKRRITTKGTENRPFFNEFLPRGKNLFQSSYPLRACFPR